MRSLLLAQMRRFRKRRRCRRARRARFVDAFQLTGTTEVWFQIEKMLLRCPLTTVFESIV
jgi:hypothetical protein